MKFIDVAKVTLISGDGGNGCVAFRKEKFVPFGGPSGGNGGNGGNIVVRGVTNKHTLMDFRINRRYKAANGYNGQSKDKAGGNGNDLLIDLPLGTSLVDAKSGKIIADITEEGRKYVILKGGEGGRGNKSFTSSSNRAPKQAENGTPGTTLEIELNLKIIADVGVIGMPNAGKSTFIKTISAANPKVADYPFTTLTPNLGVIKSVYGQPYVIADMPGLIEGAHKGVGLGQRFLKHIERTKVLTHFIDASVHVDEDGGYDGEDGDQTPELALMTSLSMIDRYNLIRKELELYQESKSKPTAIMTDNADNTDNPDNTDNAETPTQASEFIQNFADTKDSETFNVLHKQEIIVATKVEAAHSEELERFKTHMAKLGKKVFCISSMTRQGVDELLLEMQTAVDNHEHNQNNDDEHNEQNNSKGTISGY